MRFHFLVLVFVLLTSWTMTSHRVHAGCTYVDIDFDLYTCLDTHAIAAEFALPYMSSIDAVTFCATGAQSNIRSCVEGIITACGSVSNVTRFFGASGQNLLAGYEYLCEKFTTYSPEPFGCSNSVDASYVKGNISEFDDAIDALSNPTIGQICSAASTMKTGLLAELEAACGNTNTYPNSKQIWTFFLQQITAACSSSGHLTISAILVTCSIVFGMVLSLQ